jgi:hypothetical protein
MKSADEDHVEAAEQIVLLIERVQVEALASAQTGGFQGPSYLIRREIIGAGLGAMPAALRLGGFRPRTDSTLRRLPPSRRSPG